MHHEVHSSPSFSNILKSKFQIYTCRTDSTSVSNSHRDWPVSLRAEVSKRKVRQAQLPIWSGVTENFPKITLQPLASRCIFSFSLVENSDSKKIKTCSGKPGGLQDDETDEEDRKNSSHNPVKDQAPSLKSNGLAVRYQYCKTMYSLCIYGERWMPFFSELLAPIYTES